MGSNRSNVGKELYIWNILQNYQNTDTYVLYRKVIGIKQVNEILYLQMYLHAHV